MRLIIQCKAKDILTIQIKFRNGWGKKDTFIHSLAWEWSVTMAAVHTVWLPNVEVVRATVARSHC